MILLIKEKNALQKAGRNLDVLTSEEIKLLNQVFKQEYVCIFSDNVNKERYIEDANLIMVLGAAIETELGISPENLKNAMKAVYQKWNKPVLVNYHPMYVMQKPTLFADFNMQIERIPYILNMPVIKDTYKMIKSDIEFNLAFDKYAGIVSMDIETTGFNFMTDTVIAIGIATEKHNYIIERDKIDLLMPCLLKFFKRQDIKFIWQNGKFDTKFFVYQWGAAARVDEDILLMHYALNERRGIHGLDDMATYYLNAPDYEKILKAHIPRGGNYSDVPIDILDTYLMWDIRYTLEIYKILNKEIQKSTQKTKLYRELLLPANTMLRDVELTGIKIDIAYLNKLDLKYKADLSSMETTLSHLASGGLGFTPQGYRMYKNSKVEVADFNPNSPSQVAYILYNLIKLPLYENQATTKSEAIQHFIKTLKIDEETALTRPDYHFLWVYSNYKSKQKLYSSYIKGMREHIFIDQRIHPSFLLHGTETGRLSCANPNMQNIPRNKEIKNLITVEKGNVLLECDYSQAELRVLAELSKDPFLKQTYDNDEDLHSAVARQLFGDNYTKEQRVKAKAVNFGLAYGMTAYTLAKTYDMTYEEAQEVIDAWYEKIPQAGEFIKNTRLTINSDAEYYTPFGRYRDLGLVTDENINRKQNEAINTPIQSIASDLTLASAIKIHEWLLNNKKGKIINLVHDAILIETTLENLDIIVTKVLDTMCQVPKDYLHATVPFKAEAEVAIHWGCKTEYKEGITYVDLL